MGTQWNVKPSFVCTGIAAGSSYSLPMDASCASQPMACWQPVPPFQVSEVAPARLFQVRVAFRGNLVEAMVESYNYGRKTTTAGGRRFGSVLPAASPTQWTWIWVNPGRQWRTWEPGVLQSTGLQSRIPLSNWTKTTTCWVTDFSSSLGEPPYLRFGFIVSIISRGDSQPVCLRGLAWKLSRFTHLKGRKSIKIS